MEGHAGAKVIAGLALAGGLGRGQAAVSGQPRQHAPARYNVALEDPGRALIGVLAVVIGGPDHNAGGVGAERHRRAEALAALPAGGLQRGFLFPDEGALAGRRSDAGISVNISAILARRAHHGEVRIARHGQRCAELAPAGQRVAQQPLSVGDCRVQCVAVHPVVDGRAHQQAVEIAVGGLVRIDRHRRSELVGRGLAEQFLGVARPRAALILEDVHRAGVRAPADVLRRADGDQQPIIGDGHRAPEAAAAAAVAVLGV